MSPKRNTMFGRHIRPSVVWLTGLSGSGKSTLSLALCDALRSMAVPAQCLDGDVIRDVGPIGFSREEREAHIARIGYFASILEQHGVVAICAVISPYAEGRARVRAMCRRFLEIHVSTPLTECERRDPKGLYARARQGQVTNLTGVAAPYEPPREPDLQLDTSKTSVAEAVRLLLDVIADGDSAHSRRADGESASAPSDGGHVTALS